MSDHLRIVLSLVIGVALITPIYASDITISGAQTTTQNLDNDDNLTVTSDGSISDTGKAIDEPFGNNLTIINNGVISGDFRGVDVPSSTNISIVNVGRIQSDDKAIEANDAVDFSLDNSGVIQSDGYAISISRSSRSSVLNTGLISGDRYAIDSGGGLTTSFTVTNYGTMQSNGSDSTLKVHSNTIINNYGLIEQKIAGGRALSLNSNDNTVLFGEGSRIIGNIRSGDRSNTLSFDVGATQSYVYQIDGSAEIEDLDGRPVVEGSAMAAGIGNLETVDELMASRSQLLRNALDRLNRQAPGDFGRQALVDVYADTESRDRDETASAYDLDSAGLTLVTPMTIAGAESFLFVNYHEAQLDVTNGTHEIDGESLRLGLAVPTITSFGNVDIGVLGLFGLNQWDGTREVLVNTDTTTGVIRRDASWDSMDLEFAMNALTRHSLSEDWRLHGAARLGMHYEDIDGYTESDEFQWDSRSVLQVYGQLATGLTYQRTDALELYGTASLTQRDVSSGERADYRINGTAVSYQGGYYDALQVALRLGAVHRLTDALTLSVEAQGSDTNRADAGWGLSIGVNAQF